MTGILGGLLFFIDRLGGLALVVLIGRLAWKQTKGSQFARVVAGGVVVTAAVAAFLIMKYDAQEWGDGCGFFIFCVILFIGLISLNFLRDFLEENED